MGMAASQARYLALTARKTNTEWEGQQINQARTALANQSANLFNRLLGLEVPTPPNKTDYTELQYSYEDGTEEGSVIEHWEQLGNQAGDYNYIVKHYYMANVLTGSQKELRDPQVQLGDVLNEMHFDPATTTITRNVDASGNVSLDVKYKVAGAEQSRNYDKLSKAQADSDPQLKTAISDFATAKGLAIQDGYPLNDNVYGWFDSSSNTWHFFMATDYNKVTQSQVDAEEALKKALEEKGYLDKDGQLISNVYYYKSGDKYYFTVESDTTTDNTIAKAVDNNDYSMAYNSPAYVGNSRLKELNELIQNDSIDQVAELAQILRDCPNSAINQYISFNAAGDLEYTGNGIYTFELNGKTYYTTKSDLLSSYNSSTRAGNTIDTQSNLNYYNAAVISKKIEESNKALMETDSKGRFTSVRFDNDSVTYRLNVEQVTNETAYNDAHNQYLYQKAQYEKTIADINAKTSIIQKEDRTLELRLKQLDTEQNALATEMDAVKKVIKDNVEKTFKTFSD